MKRAVAAICVTVLATGVWAGCERARGPVGTSSERIIAVAPSVVETLFALGLGERVVAVGEYARWPPQVAGKTRIGGLMDPRLETIAALDPDLAVLIESESALARELRGLDLEVLVVPSESVADVEQAIASIAARTGTEGAGQELIDGLRDALAPRPVGAQARLLLLVGREPGNLSELYAAASGTFLDELADRLGAVNVMADAPVRYPRVGLEVVLARRPEIVVELVGEDVAPEVARRLIEDWRREAVGDGPCVAVVAGDHVLIPGPRLGRVYEELAAAIAGCVPRP